MGSSHSQISNSGTYKKELKYYPDIDFSIPLEDQNYYGFDQEEFSRILNGDYANVFEDEDVEQVWIFYCPLNNERFGPLKGVASLLGAPFLNHEFVMIKTEKWIYVVAKGTAGCVCYQAKHGLESKICDLEKQFEEAATLWQPDPTPKISREEKGKGRLYDVIRWMEKGIVEETYNWLTSNCQKFARALFNLLAEKSWEPPEDDSLTTLETMTLIYN